MHFTLTEKLCGVVSELFILKPFQLTCCLPRSFCWFYTMFLLSGIHMFIQVLDKLVYYAVTASVLDLRSPTSFPVILSRSGRPEAQTTLCSRTAA